MGRSKTYNSEDVLKKAMRVFWKNGYADTSIAQLEEATGISRISLYHEFKDKEQLFLATLDQYHGNGGEMLKKKLGAGGLEAIKTVFEKHLDPKSTTSSLGCFVVNTAVEQVPLSKAIRERVREYRGNIKAAFTAGLETEKGLLIDSSDIEGKAEYLTTTLWGVLVTNRLYRSPEHSAAVVKQIHGVIDSWKK